MQLFVNTFLKLFFLLTPFFVLTVFLALTRELGEGARRRIALKCTAAVLVTCFVLFLFGQYIFALLGITLDAFRVGAGVLLFLSGVSLVQGPPAVSPGKRKGPEDIAVVPLAIPVTVGPATTGALLVLSAELTLVPEKVVVGSAVAAAVVLLGGLLYAANSIERAMGPRRLVILRKLTGLVLCSLAAQMILTGVHNFWFSAGK
jgi:multiple antibiotic resistance protein